MVKAVLVVKPLEENSVLVVAVLAVPEVIVVVSPEVAKVSEKPVAYSVKAKKMAVQDSCRQTWCRRRPGRSAKGPTNLALRTGDVLDLPRWLPVDRVGGRMKSTTPDPAST